MAEPSLTTVFGANATQTATDLVIKKSDLVAVGFTPATVNTAESLLIGIMLKFKTVLTSDARDTNVDQSVAVVDGYSPSITTRNSTIYLRNTISVEVFIFTSNSANILRGTTVNPYTNNDYDTFLNNSRLGTPNTTYNGRDILMGITLLSQSSTGVACRTSDDFGIASCNGNARYDLLPVAGTTQQYLVVNNVSGGLVIRVQ
jgi:hypothetical protein